MIYHVRDNGRKVICMRHWPCPTCEGGVEERRCRICELTDPNHPDYSPSFKKLYEPRDEPMIPRMNRVPRPSPMSPEPGPGLIQRAGAFTRAMVAQTTEMIRTRSLAIVSDEVKTTRLSICQSCEKYTGNPSWPCKICGCSSLKLHLKTSACPVGKWMLDP